jgi:CRP-like cAMP-binding protein
MPNRPVTLIVQQGHTCRHLKEGDRWSFVGAELKNETGAKFCATGVCSVYPKLVDILKSLPAEASLPDDYLLCDAPECDTAFRMIYTSDFALTRRMERGAEHATQILKKQGPFLSRLSKELATEIVGEGTLNSYDVGQCILKQGEVGQHFFIVKTGQVEVARHTENNEETILVTLGVGDCFGEMSILTGDMTTAEVRAGSVCEILSIPKDAFEALLIRRPSLAREFSKLLAGRLKATNSSLENELARGVLGRLSMIPLLDLVQALSQGHRTGTLMLNYSGKKAQLGFRNGNMVSAILGDLLGEEAFYHVAGWADGDFCFETQTTPDESGHGKIKMDLMGLMMEAMRRIDEAKAKSQ